MQYNTELVSHLLMMNDQTQISLMSLCGTTVYLLFATVNILKTDRQTDPNVCIVKVLASYSPCREKESFSSVILNFVARGTVSYKDVVKLWECP